MCHLAHNRRVRKQLSKDTLVLHLDVYCLLEHRLQLTDLTLKLGVKSIRFFCLSHELLVTRLKSGDVFSLLLPGECSIDVLCFCLLLLFGLVAQLMFQLGDSLPLLCILLSLVVQLLAGVEGRKVLCLI